MSSEAVNLNTICNFLSTKLYPIPKNVIKDIFYYDSGDDVRILNVKTVYDIIRQLIIRGFGYGSGKDRPQSANVKDVCSVNTLKQIYDYLMENKSWNIIDNTTDMVYGKNMYALHSSSFSGTLFGGGGGSGAGAAANSNQKNGSATARGGNGATGGNSTITKNGGNVATANGAGGGGGASATSNNNGWKTASGSAGSSSGGKQFTVSYNTGDYIKINIGYGGGGGASANVTNGNSTGGNGNGSNGGSGWTNGGAGGVVSAGTKVGNYTKGGGSQVGDYMGAGGAGTGSDSYPGSGGNSGGFKADSKTVYFNIV